MKVVLELMWWYMNKNFTRQ